MTSTEVGVLKKISDVINGSTVISKKEKQVLNSIISDYSKPKIKEENKK